MPDFFRNNENIKAPGVQLEFTPEQIEEAVKCSEDPSYFAINYLKAENVDRGIIPFEPREYQQQMFDHIHDNRFSLIMIGRQSGKTLVAAAYILWFALFHSERTVAILANKAEMAQEILHRLQVMYELLPYWIKPGVLTYNKRSIDFANGSRIFCSATTASAIRGRSISLLYVDELAFIPRNVADPFLASVYPTVMSGTDTKIVFSSTPNGLNHFWELWEQAESGQGKFKNLYIHYLEIKGRTEKWAEEQRKLLGTVRFNQEIGCQFIGSSATLISGQTLKDLRPRYPIVDQNGLKIFDRKEEDHPYVMTVDVSRGVHGDYSTFSVIDVATIPYKVVATYRDNTVSPLVFPSVIHSICKEYNDALCLIETNDLGQQVADVLHTDFEYENILYTKSMGRSGVQISQGGPRSVRGIRTTKPTKAIGCSTARDLIENHKIILSDEETLKEFYHFVENTSGSFEAEDGYHDDMVMTIVLFGWLVSRKYFRDLFENNLRLDIFGDKLQKIEEELLPPPIIVTGLEEEGELVGNMYFHK